jgi:hypothetical protein
MDKRRLRGVVKSSIRSKFASSSHYTLNRNRALLTAISFFVISLIVVYVIDY